MHKLSLMVQKIANVADTWVWADAFPKLPCKYTSCLKIVRNTWRITGAHKKLSLLAAKTYGGDVWKAKFKTAVKPFQHFFGHCPENAEQIQDVSLVFFENIQESPDLFKKV